MSKTEIAQVMARRELIDERDPKRRIVISFGVPRQVTSRGWRCDVRIEGLGRAPVSRDVMGFDSLQALTLALQFVRMNLKDSPSRLAWPLDGLPCPAGDIPLQVPIDLGEEFAERVERLIKRESPRLLETRWKMIRAHIREADKRREASHERAPSRGRRSQ